MPSVRAAIQPNGRLAQISPENRLLEINSPHVPKGLVMARRCGVRLSGRKTPMSETETLPERALA
jgi:hypothetical protein